MLAGKRQAKYKPGLGSSLGGPSGARITSKLTHAGPCPPFLTPWVLHRSSSQQKACSTQACKPRQLQASLLAKWKPQFYISSLQKGAPCAVGWKKWQVLPTLTGWKKLHQSEITRTKLKASLSQKESQEVEEMLPPRSKGGW